MSPVLRLLLLALLWVTTSLAAPSLAGAGDCEHVVKKGDTARRIAYKYGLTHSELVALNPSLKKDPDMIRLGQKLKVCGKRPKKSRNSGKGCGGGGTIVDYEVSKGDTLSRIAARYGVTEKEVLSRNPSLGGRADHIRLGQTLQICAHRTRVKNSKLCGYRTPVHRHRVVPGEHLGGIAGRYGVRRKDIIRLNASLSDPDRLRPGQMLRVCPEIAPRERSEITYTVRSGDTLGSIAGKYGLTVWELQRFQRGNLADPNRLREGQKLRVWADGDILPGFGGSNDKGKLKGGIQLPPGRHYTRKWDLGSWGTGSTVRSIQASVARYKKRNPGGPKVHIGDISKRDGGKFPPHVSHQKGRDVDVGYVLTDSHKDDVKFYRATASNLDVARTWTLVQAFLDSDDVVYIFMDHKIQKILYEYARKRGVGVNTLDELFQYPRSRHRGHGIIRHEKGHVTHFHVRFRR